MKWLILSLRNSIVYILHDNSYNSGVMKCFLNVFGRKNNLFSLYYSLWYKCNKCAVRSCATLNMRYQIIPSEIIRRENVIIIF